jgi:hypothetical protein
MRVVHSINTDTIKDETFNGRSKNHPLFRIPGVKFPEEQLQKKYQITGPLKRADINYKKGMKTYRPRLK